MREVEKKISKDHHMAMIMAEVKTMMLACRGMGGDQDIMETLWSVRNQRFCVICLVPVHDGRCEKFPFVES